jgi:DNA-binding transcriptional LysR family regulator
MNWDDLRLLLAIARAGSLLAAARALGVDHGTLSRRLGAFERTMGVPLFVRDRGGVRPTRDGEELLPLAEQAEASVLAIERRREALVRDIAGTVRLATSGILAKALVAPHVPSLRRAQPALRLELTVGRPLVNLARGEADLALRLRPVGAKLAEPSILVVRVATVAWAVFGARGRAEGRTLRGPWVRYAGYEPGAEWVARRVRPEDVALRVDDVPTAFEAARAGVGLAVLPCFYVGRGDGLVRVARGVDEHHLVIAVHAELRHVPRVDAVIRWLKATATRERGRLEGR